MYLKIAFHVLWFSAILERSCFLDVCSFPVLAPLVIPYSGEETFLSPGQHEVPALLASGLASLVCSGLSGSCAKM